MCYLLSMRITPAPHKSHIKKLGPLFAVHLQAETGSAPDNPSRINILGPIAVGAIVLCTGLMWQLVELQVLHLGERRGLDLASPVRSLPWFHRGARPLLADRSHDGPLFGSWTLLQGDVHAIGVCRIPAA